MAPGRTGRCPGRILLRLPVGERCGLPGQREDERIVKEAHQNRRNSVNEITKQAKRAAENLVEDARGREREIRSGAEDYVDEILHTLEVNLLNLIDAVQHGREQLAGEDLQSATTLSRM